MAAPVARQRKRVPPPRKGQVHGTTTCLARSQGQGPIHAANSTRLDLISGAEQLPVPPIRIRAVQTRPLTQSRCGRSHKPMWHTYNALGTKQGQSNKACSKPKTLTNPQAFVPAAGTLAAAPTNSARTPRHARTRATIDKPQHLHCTIQSGMGLQPQTAASCICSQRAPTTSTPCTLLAPHNTITAPREC